MPACAFASSRRLFLRAGCGSGVALAASLLAACGGTGASLATAASTAAVSAAPSTVATSRSAALTSTASSAAATSATSVASRAAAASASQPPAGAVKLVWIAKLKSIPQAQIDAYISSFTSGHPGVTVELSIA
jgi:hypothetical protein